MGLLMSVCGSVDKCRSQSSSDSVTPSRCLTPTFQQYLIIQVSTARYAVLVRYTSPATQAHALLWPQGKVLSQAEAKTFRCTNSQCIAGLRHGGTSSKNNNPFQEEYGMRAELMRASSDAATFVHRTATEAHKPHVTPRKSILACIPHSHHLHKIRVFHSIAQPWRPPRRPYRSQKRFTREALRG